MNNDSIDYTQITKSKILKDSAFVNYYFSYWHKFSINTFVNDSIFGWKMVSSRKFEN